MDFRHQITAPSGLADLEVDALVLVVGVKTDPALAAPLRALIDSAVSEGDLTLKKGKLLYLHRPAGVAAKRLVVVVAGDDSAKSFKAAVAAGLGTLKTSGASSVGIAAGTGRGLGEAAAEAVVVAAADAAYLYTHTKPSAPPAWTPKVVTVYSQKADEKAVQRGVRRGGNRRGA
jgi:leucyl aminopeptidase